MDQRNEHDDAADKLFIQGRYYEASVHQAMADKQRDAENALLNARRDVPTYRTTVADLKWIVKWP